MTIRLEIEAAYPSRVDAMSVWLNIVRDGKVVKCLHCGYCKEAADINSVADVVSRTARVIASTLKVFTDEKLSTKMDFCVAERAVAEGFKQWVS